MPRPDFDPEIAAQPHDCWEWTEEVRTDGPLGVAHVCSVCRTLVAVG